MPKQVDHEQRRQHIAEALWRVVSHRGLEAASLNEIAAEAGVSKGLVQHYFKTRDQIFLFAAGHLQQQLTERTQRHLAELPQPASALDILRGVLVSLLPLGEEGRTEGLVSSALFNRAIAQPSVAEHYRNGNALMHEALAALFAAAQEGGDLLPDLSPEQEAVILFALVGGLSERLLLDQMDKDAALATIDYHLTRLRT